MNKIRLIVAAGFVLAFAAGGSVGMLAGPEVAPPPPPEPGEWLARHLELTAEQREKMRAIWTQLGDPRDWRRGFDLMRQRDEAIEALLTDEQRARKREIVEEFGRKMAELEREKRQRIEQAVEETKKILTPSQAERYEEMRRRQHRRRPGPPPGWRPGGPFGRGRRGGPRTRGAGPGRFPDGPGPFRGPRHRGRYPRGERGPNQPADPRLP